MFYSILILLIIYVIVLYNYPNFNERPLSIAINAKSAKIVKFLVEHGAMNIN